MHLHIHTRNTISSDHRSWSQSHTHILIHAFTQHLHTTHQKKKSPFHIRNEFVDGGKNFFYQKHRFPFILRFPYGGFAAQMATEADPLMNIRKLLAVESCTFSHLFFIIEFHSVLSFASVSNKIIVIHSFCLESSTNNKRKKKQAINITFIHFKWFVWWCSDRKVLLFRLLIFSNQ